MTLDIRTRDGSTVYTAARNGNVLGYVAVNSTVAGRSCGGVRMMPDLTEDEVRALARAMTLKYGYLGLPQGGAKAGVIGDPEAPEGERRTILGEFAREIAPLLRARAFIPSTDMGTSNADIRFMLESAGVKVRRRELLGNSSGYYTAVSAVAGVAEAARRAGLALSRATAAVEGFGRVGREVAAIKRFAPGKLAYINLLPGYAKAGAPNGFHGAADYTDYLEQFVANAKPQIISYDNYDIVYSDNGQSSETAAKYLRNLAEVRRVSVKHGIPFWNIVCCNRIRPYTTVPSPANLLLQAYTTLAAGARGITWYRYHQSGEIGRASCRERV